MSTEHRCHWPGCERTVPPALWGCKSHWFALPARLRAEIWRTYRRGQEVTKHPSAEYLKAAHDVQAWITEYRAGSGAKGLVKPSAAPAGDEGAGS